MHKLALLIALSLLLSACGRGPTDFYRAYNIYVVRDAKGNVLPDLATQNRTSLQSQGELTYIYTVPNQEVPTGDAETDESEAEAASADESLPEDAPAEDSAELDGLSDAVDELASALTEIMEGAE